MWRPESISLRTCAARSESMAGEPVPLLQINIFMGLGLLSMPYAMRLSGWLGLAAMAALTCLFCLSGKLIVHAFDKMPPHCAQSYPNLGQYQARQANV